MTRSTFFCTCFCLGFFFRVQAQGYIEYQRTFNRMDADISRNDLSSACERLDSIYRGYTFVYAAHCIKALQIACVQEDFVRADAWLQKSFLQGVPLWIIRNNAITRTVFENEQTAETLSQYDSLHAVYVVSLNEKVLAVIDSLYEIDQRKTRKVNDGFILLRPFYFLSWYANNKRQARIIKEITEQYGFPGEQLIGIPGYYQDSAQANKAIDLYGPVINDFRAYIMLIHYFSNPRPDMNNLLLENVNTGCIPAYQYGALNDFQARWGNRKNRNSRHYNVWHTDSDTTHIPAIDERRQAIGLNLYKEQKMNEAIRFDRRKNRTSQLYIIPE